MSRLARLAAFAPWAVLFLACGPHTQIRATSAGTVSTTTGSSVTGQTLTERPVEAPQAWLWRISGGDAAAPSYVLGTMHVGIRLPDALPHPYDDYLAQARVLVMEVDLREAERFFREQGEHAPRRRVRPLDRQLGRESWARLVAEVDGHVPEAVLRQAPPVLISLYLQQVYLAAVEAAAEGREPIPGVPSTARLDETIFQNCITDGCSFVALETPEQAMVPFEGTGVESDALAQLRALVDDRAEAIDQMAALRSAYLAFDEIAILQAIGQGMTPALHDALFLQRNRAWEAALLPQIQRGNAFVAVGLGHLLGGGSVLEALAQHGYTVERLGEPPTE
ncbi:MAG: TraB/GumN family protein [Sandaracinus sp.]